MKKNYYHYYSRTARDCKSCSDPSFFLNISVARWNSPVRLGVFIKPSKLGAMTLRFSKKFNQLSNDVNGSEGGVEWFLGLMWYTWWPFNHKWEQIQCCCVCFEDAEVTMLVATLPCTEIVPRSTGNANDGRLCLCLYKCIFVCVYVYMYTCVRKQVKKPYLFT